MTCVCKRHAYNLLIFNGLLEHIYTRNLQRILGDNGHLSNESSGQLINQILHNNLKHIVLAHLSKENNYEDLAFETVRSEITMADSEYKGDDFNIVVAKRNVCSAMFEV